MSLKGDLDALNDYFTKRDVASERRNYCCWAEDSDGNWETQCGHEFIIIDGSPRDNGMRFCTYCGGKLAQVDFVDEAEHS